MALDDDIEPVCVEGIEIEVAYDRLRDLNHISRGHYWGHRIAERKSFALFIAEGCLLLSFWNPLAIMSGAVFIAAGVYYDFRLAREQRQAVRFLEENYRH
ncbi:MAG: hypothetical protein QME12_01450 [Nanoarchaeota archaeon]|nr:hypothetical protein [Nanoarchaeota archaeon]